MSKRTNGITVEMSVWQAEELRALFDMADLHADNGSSGSVMAQVFPDRMCVTFVERDVAKKVKAILNDPEVRP